MIVGVGQAIQREDGRDTLRSPIDLAAEAFRAAAEDSAAGDVLLRRADSIACVPSTCWGYRDEAALVAAELGVDPGETVLSPRFGGNGPLLLLGDAAARIAAGDLDIVLVGGAECFATWLHAGKNGLELQWANQGEDVAPTRAVGSDRDAAHPMETAAGLAPPAFAYALIECAVRAREHRSADQHLTRIAALWSRFSEVASRNSHAWLREARTGEEIATPNGANRSVSSPYTKLLTANIQVDLGAGVILASAEAAAAAGVPRERWVFVHAMAGAGEEWFLSERAELAASPAIAAVGRGALEQAGLTIDEIAHLDLYSCFPSAVEIAAQELGFDVGDNSRIPTVTGGLTFAGGPGNNYSTHGLAAMVGRLREHPDDFGLTTALGWYLTKHAAGVYSCRPPSQPFQNHAPEVARPPARVAKSAYEGRVTVEAYTVPYERDGSPAAGIVSALTPDGARTIVRAEGEQIGSDLLAADPLGREVEVGPGRIAL